MIDYLFSMCDETSASAIISSPISRRIRGCLLRLRIRGAIIKSVCKWSLLLVSAVVAQLCIRHGVQSGVLPSFHVLQNRRLPSSLTSNPVSALVPPGQCQFGNKEFTSVALLKRWKISPTSVVLRFGLPNASQPLNLSTCACLLAQANVRSPSEEGKEVIRPYTPISTNAQIGSFDLLVKDYGESDDGSPRLSHYLGTTLREGDETVSFSHIPFNVKIQAPFEASTIGMIAGGTGITPMIQAAHAILGDPTSSQNIVLLYGSKRSDDILAKELLDSWARQHPRRLKIVHVLSQEDGPNSIRGQQDGGNGDNVEVVRGQRIDGAMVARHFPPPAESLLIFVCGPPSMYETFSGPREEEALGGVLKDLGYEQQQVYKF